MFQESVATSKLQSVYSVNIVQTVVARLPEVKPQGVCWRSSPSDGSTGTTSNCRGISNSSFRWCFSRLQLISQNNYIYWGCNKQAKTIVKIGDTFNLLILFLMSSICTLFSSHVYKRFVVIQDKAFYTSSSEGVTQFIFQEVPHGKHSLFFVKHLLKSTSIQGSTLYTAEKI